MAREHADEVRVIGLGAKDSADEAADFVRDYGTYSFPMYWDETFESWTAFEVIAQPAAVLVTADGDELARWQGEFDENEVLEVLRGS